MESEANASPEDVEKQVKLFKELVVSGAERAVVSRWETAMLAVSASSKHDAHLADRAGTLYNRNRSRHC